MRPLAWLGLGLLCIGQVCLLLQEPLLPITQGADLDRAWLLELPNPNSILLGLALQLIGLCCWIPALRALPALPQRSPAVAPTRVDGRLPLIPAALILLALMITALISLLLSVPTSAAWMIWCWLLAIGLALFAALLLDRRRGVVIEPSFTRLDLGLVALLTSAGLLISTHRLSEVPSYLWLDESPFLDMARMLVAGSVPPDPFALGVFTFPLLSSIYQSWLVGLLSDDLWAWRLSSALAACAAIPPTYLLAHALFGRRLALITCLVMVALPFWLSFARIGYNNAHALLPTTLAVYAAYAALRHRSLLLAAIGGAVAGAGFYTYTGARLGALVGALLFAAVLLRALAQLWRPGAARVDALRQLRAALAGGTAFLGLCAIVAVPLLVSANATKPGIAQLKMLETLVINLDYARIYFPEAELLRDQPALTVGPVRLFARADLAAQLARRAVVRTMLAFQHDRMVDLHFVVGPLAGSVTAIFYLLGMAAALRMLWRPAALLVLSWFLIGMLVLSGIHSWTPRGAHLVSIIPALCMLIALGVTSSTDLLFGDLRVARWRAAHLAQGALVAAALVSGGWHYFVRMPQVYRPELLEQAMQRSLQLEPGATLVYVARDDQDRTQALWLDMSIPLESTFERPLVAEVADGSYRLDPARAYLVIYHEEDALLVRAALALAGRSIEQPFIGPNGAIIGRWVVVGSQ
jgi:Dolichyl-phosphate-mannose-protein mannosyltransferase